MQRHPYEFVSPAHRARAWVICAAAAIVVMLAINLTGGPTITAAAPQGIVSFELAGDAQTAGQILSSWNLSARERAAFGLGLDFLFPLLYAGAIGGACVWAAGAFRPVWPGLAAGGVLLAWEMLLAATFDYLENIALTMMLFGGEPIFLPEVARALALLKFSLIGVALVYVTLGALLHVVRVLVRR
jgi:hypothetical protein